MAWEQGPLFHLDARKRQGAEGRWNTSAENREKDIFPNSKFDASNTHATDILLTTAPQILGVSFLFFSAYLIFY